MAIPREEKQAIKDLVDAAGADLPLLKNEEQDGAYNGYAVDNGHVQSVSIWQAGFNEMPSLKMKYLPETIGNLTQMTHLTVSHSSITRLPDSICDCAMLECLVLDNNRLEQLPGIIGKLEGLKAFSLQENNFERIPVQIWPLVELNRLDISMNPLEPADLKAKAEATAWGTNANGEIVGAGIPHFLRYCFQTYTGHSPSDNKWEPDEWRRFDGIFVDEQNYRREQLKNYQMEELEHHARALRESGQLEASIEVYNHLLSQQPPSVPAAIWLNNMKMDQGHLADATRYFSDVYNASAANKVVFGLYLGIAEFKQGNLDRSESLFKECLQNNPDHGIAWYFLGRIYIAKKNIQEAIESLKRAIASYGGYDYDWYTPKMIKDALQQVS